jgi:inner membrane protein
VATIFSHPVIPVVLAGFFPKDALPATVLLAGMVCSILPDLDVIGLKFGVPYEDVLGHRGLSHSIAFAALIAGLLMLFVPVNEASGRWLIFLFLFLSTLSHGVLDALTDGGLGIAFFAPFQNERYFFPWRPIAVSPIGIERFFTSAGWRAIVSELKWVWLPALCLMALLYSLKAGR